MITNELLRAYYGSGHSSVHAIEYDIDKLKESLNHNRYFQFIFDFNVEYTKSIPNKDISVLHGKDIIHTLKTFLEIKSLSWKNEEVYCLIVERKGLFNIDFRAITNIYFRYRMQEKEMDYVME